MKLTGETITDAQIDELSVDAEEWVVAHGRRLRLAWWIFEALHGQADVLKARGRAVCAEYINARNGASS